MSIAITAPQKFDFQDIVCVELMLRFAHVTDARFFVEPKGGEDGELHFTQNPSGRRAEIQVKGASGSITLATVVTCLAHTPPRTEENTLLERLLSDPDRLVVLVMSGRCDDACAPYTVGADWDGTPHRVGTVTRAQATALLDAFAAARIPGTDTGELKARRRAHNDGFAKTANKSVVRTALGRLIIIERVDAVNLEAICAERLRRRHRVPSDRIGDVLGQLRAGVKTAKADRIDAFPLIRDTLTSAVPPRVRPLDYVKRDAESALFNELSSSGVLLLSGTPRVGKTFAARWIAAEFEPHGYEVQQFGDVDRVERFLLEPTDAPRLAILDDPLDGTYAVADPGRTLARVEALISCLPQRHKLIVAQGEQRLLATTRAAALSAVSTAGHLWHDMGVLSAPFLAELWRSLVDRPGVPDALRRFVSEALADGSLRLEPGCLQHFAVNHQRLGDQPNLDQVARLARENASGLSYVLAETGCEHLLSTLALTTTAQERIDVTELAFATGTGGDSLPSKSTHGGFVIIGGRPRGASPAPDYDHTPRLTANQLDALDKLERDRLIEVDNHESVGFVHSFYRAAAEAMLNGPTRRAAATISTTVQRGLFCSSPLTSRATARNLDWAFDKLARRVEAQSALVDHAVDGLTSYFPATRDLCFRFLVQRLADLPADRRSEFPQWISSITSIRLDGLEWSNGEAHLPFGEALGTDYIDRVFRRVRRSEVATELSLLNAAEGEYVSPERAAKALIFLAKEPSALSLPAIGRLLSYDEAALRAEATKVWLRTSRDDDDVVLARIFADDHPSCALAALKGAIAGWHVYSTPRRKQILGGLSFMAETTVCAAAMLNHLVLFDRVEVTGEDPPWPIFEAVLPVIMQALPHNAAFIDARLFAVARSAVEALPSASMVAICDGWIGWLERNNAEGRLPSEFSLGVGEILVSATRREPDLRDGRIDRMLGFQGTGAMITFVADLVNDWDELADGERTALVARLKAGRSDDRWLQAVALTRSTVPTTVQRTLLGDEVSLSDGPDALLAKVGSDLLNAAVHVYSGRPQTLGWLGTDHSGETVWEPVVDRIARMPSHPLFELAWDHIACSGDGARVSSVITCVGGENADRMLGILIRLKVGCTGNYMPEAWATLLAMAQNDRTRTAWIDKMASYAPAILDKLSDLNLWLSEDRDLTEMLSRLSSDIVLLRMASTIFASPADTDVDNIRLSGIQELGLRLEKAPPRLFETCDSLADKLKRRGVVAPALTAALQQRRESILEDRKRMEDGLNRPETPLFGWVSP